MWTAQLYEVCAICYRVMHARNIPEHFDMAGEVCYGRPLD